MTYSSRRLTHLDSVTCITEIGSAHRPSPIEHCSLLAMRRSHSMLTRSRSDTCLLDSHLYPVSFSSSPTPGTKLHQHTGDVASISPRRVTGKVDGSDDKNAHNDNEKKISCCHDDENRNVHSGLKSPGKGSERKTKSHVCLSPTSGGKQHVQESRDRFRRPSPLSFLGFDLGLDLDLQSHFSFTTRNDWSIECDGKLKEGEKVTNKTSQRQCFEK